MFADHVVGGYPRHMNYRFLRRGVILVTAMLFTLSATGRGFAVTSMDMKATSAIMHMTSADPSTDMDCGGADPAKQLVCHFLCANAVTVLSEPVQMQTMIVLHVSESFYLQKLLGRDGPPDPYPPRPVALS